MKDFFQAIAMLVVVVLILGLMVAKCAADLGVRYVVGG